MEDAVDATDAVCWRRIDSSRVNRFTCGSFDASAVEGSTGMYTFGARGSHLPLLLALSQALDGDPKSSAVEDDAMALVLLVEEPNRVTPATADLP